jgi:hypothetical protein
MISLGTLIPDEEPLSACSVSGFERWPIDVEDSILFIDNWRVPGLLRLAGVSPFMRTDNDNAGGFAPPDLDGQLTLGALTYPMNEQAG